MYNNIKTQLTCLIFLALQENGSFAVTLGASELVKLGWP